jgi:type I restriction enzyme S subunit
MLGDLVDIKGGGTPSKSVPEYWGGTIPWASVKDLKGGTLERTDDYITELAVSGSSTNVIPAGSVIVPTRMALGKVAINAVDMAINQDLKALQVRDGSKLLSRYLFRFLESKAQFLEGQGKGATVKGITLDVLKGLEIPLPPLPEQKRIAAILDKADAIRRKRQQAIQLADDFLRAVFLDMFGDPVTNPKGWSRVSLRDIIMDWTPGVTIQPGDFTDNGFHVLHKGAVQRNGRIEIDQRKKTFTSNEFAKANSKAVIDSEYLAVNLRDLVPTGPSIGLVADLSVYGSKEYLLAYGAYGFKVDRNKVAPDYLIALTNDSGFRREFARVWVGSTQIHIRKDDFFDLEIPFPDFGYQEKYKFIVESIRRISASKMKTFDGDKFFSSLSQKAFRGEL